MFPFTSLRDDSSQGSSYTEVRAYAILNKEYSDTSVSASVSVKSVTITVTSSPALNIIKGSDDFTININYNTSSNSEVLLFEKSFSNYSGAWRGDKPFYSMTTINVNGFIYFLGGCNA